MLTKLILKDYIPLVKKNVTYIELNTNDIFNIILGRNGFGKTSVLRQLTVYPPDNADFLPGGYKESHHVIGKDTYILKSTTGKSSEHHFIHNGKNLNEGNTLLVQRELVKIHFGITPNINNIITGLDVRDLFTTLSTARRKEFLMAVNPNDTSYALKVFEKLKSNLNAIKGGLKTQRQRLVVEEGRLSQLASMDSSKLQEEIDLLDDQIKNALIIHGQLQHVEHTDITPLKNEIANIISFLLGVNVSVKHPKSILLQQKERCVSTLDYYKTKEVRLSTMLTEMATQLAGHDTNNNLDSYKSRLDNINKMLEENDQRWESIKYKLDSNKEMFHPWVNLDEYGKREFAQITTELIWQIQAVNRAVDPEITSTKYQWVQKNLEETTAERNGVKSKIDELRHTLNHYNKAEAVDCPKCDHQFKLGFEKFNPEQIQGQLTVLDARLTELNASIMKRTDYINDNQGWYESMATLTRYAKNNEEIGPIILKTVKEYGVGKRDTSVLTDLIRAMGEYVETSDLGLRLREEKESVEKQIAFLESADIETMLKRAEYVERELGSVQRSITRTLKEMRAIDDQLDTIILDIQRRDRLQILTGELEEVLTRNGQYKIKQRVEQAIDELTPRKSQLISNLIRSESLNSVIQSIKDNIADLERREKHTALLMDGLSPVKGLIGYFMNDFLKSVIANMNAIIQPIWTGRLQVLNCSTSSSDEDVDLNYQFPVFSGNKDKPNKDVAFCSGGEREIINFAFRIVILRYLGERCGIPLMMDEVGVAFDELHRGRFCAYVAEQLRLDKLPQVFMISHYINQYGVFNNSNVIALNTEGLTVPVKVNQKAIIR